DRPWHVYANPVANDMLKSVQTTVKFLSKVDEVKIEYPAGKVVKDTTTGDYKTYEGKVTIKATVRRAKGDTGPLSLSVKIQACDRPPPGYAPAPAGGPSFRRPIRSPRTGQAKSRPPRFPRSAAVSNPVRPALAALLAVFLAAPAGVSEDKPKPRDSKPRKANR